MTGLLLAAGGYRRCTAKMKKPERVLGLILEYNIPVRDIRREEDGGISFCVSLWRLKALRALCKSRGITLEESCVMGLPGFLYRYRRRPGLAIGALLFILILAFFSSRIWEIRLYGGEIDRELRLQLEEAGLSEGMRIRDLDPNGFDERFLALFPENSYAGVALFGSTAVVRLQRAVPKPEMDDPSGGANLVAKTGGVIVRCEADRGMPLVGAGDEVVEGQILVTGITETPSGAYSVHRSSGKVLARTERVFETEVRLGEKEKRYTAEEITDSYPVILGKKIKIFPKSEKSSELYDTIYKRENVFVFGVFRMPFAVVTETRLPYVYADAVPDEKAALRAARDRYRAFISDELGDAAVEDEKISYSFENGTLKFSATLTAVEDIALERKFYITDPL